MKELTITKQNAIKLFTSNQVDYAIHEIEKEVLSFVPDISTATSRKDIASLARKVARSKVVLDDAGKELTTEWKAKSKLVDASRKEARDFLNDLRDRVRKPLTDWENEKEAREKKERLDAELVLAFDDAILFNELFDREKAIEAQQLEIVRQQAEYAKKIADEAIERNRVERERVLKIEAIEQGKREAKEESDRVIKEARLAEIRAEERQIELKQKAINIARRAEEDRVLEEKITEERRVNDAHIAEQKRVADIKVALEKVVEDDRIKKDASARKDRADKAFALAKSQDIEHRRVINRGVLDSLVANGIEFNQARRIVELIIKGKVLHTVINY